MILLNSTNDLSLSKSFSHLTELINPLLGPRPPYRGTPQTINLIVISISFTFTLIVILTTYLYVTKIRN